MSQPEYITEAAHGFGCTIEVTEKLFDAVSPYQHIEIYNTRKCGKMMLLDGIIQLTEYDEFAYQEMMAHLPLFAHPCPERVLVIGGGDGGVLREIAKHDCVKSVDICEIDEMVIQACKTHIPSMSCGYDDPRVKVHVMDGNIFIRDKEHYYDVIIVDSTDPVGPGEVLFGEEFYLRMRSALRKDGIIASQSESLFLFPEIVKRLVATTHKLFKRNGYAGIYVPTYPTGTIGVCVASLGGDVRIPRRIPDIAMAAKLRYYTPELHSASFVLPRFGEELLQGIVS